MVAHDADSRQPRSAALSGALGALVAAGLLRWLASRDDLWLDEIWSWWLVQTVVKSPLDVLLVLKHENNHFLNTWWIELLGPDTDGVWYRLPSVLLGSGTILLARRAVARAGLAAVRFVTILMLPSYLLVHYSSEARGYAHQIFFSLAAYLLLDRLLSPVRGELPRPDASTRTGIERALFAAVCVLGCLGHPGFLVTFCALAGWAGVVALRASRSIVRALREGIAAFGAPALVIGVLWVVNLSELANGGGPREEPWRVVLQTLSLAVGGVEHGPLAMVVGTLVAAFVAVALADCWRRGDDRGILVTFMIVIPGALIVAAGRQEVYPRYFLGTIVFLHLLIAESLARAWRRGATARLVVASLLVFSLVGNGLQIARLLRDGRGRAGEVVRFLVDRSPEGEITIGSDAPYFRHARILQYYGRKLGVQSRLRYFAGSPGPEHGPRWFLLHHLGDEWPHGEVYRDRLGNVYELVRLFPYAGLSGWQTGVYWNTRLRNASADRGQRPQVEAGPRPMRGNGPPRAAGRSFSAALGPTFGVVDVSLSRCSPGRALPDRDGLRGPIDRNA